MREMPLVRPARCAELQLGRHGRRRQPDAAGPTGRRCEAIQNDRAVDLQTKLFSAVESVNLSGSNGLPR